MNDTELLDWLEKQTHGQINMPSFGRAVWTYRNFMGDTFVGQTLREVLIKAMVKEKVTPSN